MTLLVNEDYLIDQLGIKLPDVPKASCQILKQKLPQSLFIELSQLQYHIKLDTNVKDNFVNHISNKDTREQICYSFQIHLKKSNFDVIVERLVILPEQYALVVDKNNFVRHKRSLYEAALGRLIFGRLSHEDKKWCTQQILNQNPPEEKVKKK